MVSLLESSPIPVCFDCRTLPDPSTLLRMLDYHIRHAFTNVALHVVSGLGGLRLDLYNNIGDSLFTFYPPSFTPFSLITDWLHLFRSVSMPTFDVPPCPGSPESATLSVLQAYDNPTPPSGSSQTAGCIQPHTAEDTSPLDSLSQSDFRLSAISCSSTVNLVPPHTDSAPYPRGEFKESPFRWNYPSLPDLPVDQQEIDSKSIASKGKKPAMRMLEGWKVILCCSCET